jgi:hypothetical protein
MIFTLQTNSATYSSYRYLIFSKSAEATRSPESISLKLCEDVSEILLNFSEIQTNLSTHDCAKNLIKK